MVDKIVVGLPTPCGIMRSITTDFWTKMVVMKNQLLGANFKGILSTDYNKSVFLQVIHMKTLTVTVHIL